MEWQILINPRNSDHSLNKFGVRLANYEVDIVILNSSLYSGQLVSSHVVASLLSI